MMALMTGPAPESRWDAVCSGSTEADRERIEEMGEGNEVV